MNGLKNSLHKFRYMVLALYLVFIVVKYFVLTGPSFAHGPGTVIGAAVALILSLIVMHKDTDLVSHCLIGALPVTDLLLTNSLVIIPVFAAAVFSFCLTDADKKREDSEVLLNTLVVVAAYAEGLSLVMLLTHARCLAAGGIAVRIGADVFLVVMLLIRYLYSKKRKILGVFRILCVLGLGAMLVTSVAGTYIRDTGICSMEDIQDGQKFYIRSVTQYNKTVTAIGSLLRMRDLRYGLEQQFYLKAIEDKEGYYNLCSVDKGKLMDVSGNKLKEGAGAILAAENSKKSQMWQMTDSDGYMHIISRKAKYGLRVDEEGVLRLSRRPEDFVIMSASVADNPLWCLSDDHGLQGVLLYVVVTVLVGIARLVQVLGSRRRMKRHGG